MNNKEKNIVPELRFPEFINDGEWKMDELANCLGYLQPTPYLVKSTDYNDSYKTPVLTAGKTFILGYTKEEEGVFDKNLPVIIFDDFTTGTQFVDFPFKTKSSAMKILIPKNDSNIKFVFESIQNLNFEVGVHKRHWISVYSKLRIPLPKETTEQKKIADCLSSLDEVINAETEKLELLKDHKKGLLQQLFPQEGETQPKYRFPEFKNDGDWKETTLDAVADYENGKAHEKEISKTGKYKVVNSKFISTEGEVVKFSDSVNLETTVGDVLMVLSDIPNGKALAKCFYVDKNDTYTVNQRICKITSTNINNIFLFYQLNRNKYFLRFDDGNKQTNLRKVDVLNCPILKPTNPKEQDKIANTLTSASTLIEAQTQKIEDLQAHKKGLLQQLFPNINTL
ncbi:restriction endonuclease subunit S [Psychroserpens mesophilus]|uniref:restriction endonuclease subunit S n=1 Tax=Psychroserpens mesophilus TaxID=325473 RepID=UPI003D64E36C